MRISVVVTGHWVRDLKLGSLSSLPLTQHDTGSHGGEGNHGGSDSDADSDLAGLTDSVRR